MNVTAIMTVEQVRRVAEALAPETPAIVSVFAGRIADTGVDPVPLMAEALKILRERPKAELLWASRVNCSTCSKRTPLAARSLPPPRTYWRSRPAGKDLDDYSLETVQMFRRDAIAAGFEINDGVGKTERETRDWLRSLA